MSMAGAAGPRGLRKLWLATSDAPAPVHHLAIGLVLNDDARLVPLGRVVACLILDNTIVPIYRSSRALVLWLHLWLSISLLLASFSFINLAKINILC